MTEDFFLLFLPDTGPFSLAGRWRFRHSHRTRTQGPSSSTSKACTFFGFLPLSTSLVGGAVVLNLSLLLIEMSDDFLTFLVLPFGLLFPFDEVCGILFS